MKPKLLYTLYIIILLLIGVAISNAQTNCNSSINICGTHSNTPSGIGVQELNSSNQGCLSTEHNSIWYNIHINTSGTLTFVINPNTNSDDFDFGVWQGNNCPVTTNPIRCSWAAQAGNGNTGLNNSSVDLSEGVFGDQFVKFLTVNAGEYYTILVDNFSSNNGFQISFGGSATLNCISLPITLISFDCKSNSDNIQLGWITATEINNMGYYIESSSDALKFNPIAFMEGSNDIKGSDYTYNDYFPIGDITYYRLKQEDFNGYITYSEVVTCNSNHIKLDYSYYTLLGQELKELPEHGVYIMKITNKNNVKFVKINR